MIIFPRRTYELHYADEHAQHNDWDLRSGMT